MPQQIVRAAAARIERRAGHREDVPALLECESGGDQRTGASRGLDHHDPKSHPGNEPVTTREMSRLRLGSERQLGYDRTSVVSHDIGIMVAYAYAARYPDKVERLVVMDAPIPGIAPWDEIVRNPALWHFSFHGLDAEREHGAGHHGVRLRHGRHGLEIAQGPGRQLLPPVRIPQ